MCKNVVGKYPFKAVIRRICSIGSAIALLITIAGCALIPREEVVVAPPLKEPPPVKYDYVEVKKGTFVGELICTGNFVSEKRRDLCFKGISDRLKAKHVDVGGNVRKGDILAELVTHNLQSRILQQEITLKKLRLTNEQIRANARKELEFEKIRLGKLKKMVDNAVGMGDGIESQEIEELKAQLVIQELQYDNVRVSSENSIRISEYDIKQNELQLEDLKKQLDDSKLVAPFDGTVTYMCPIREGEMVEAYKMIVSVSDLSSLNVEYGGDQVHKFALGKKVQIINNAHTYTGEVIATPSDVPADADEKIKKTVKIRVNEPLMDPKDIEVTKSDKATDLEIGKSVQVILPLLKKENAIFISKSLIHTLGDRTFVWVLENGMKKERDLELGDENTTEVLVINGLAEGDMIIKE